ncbi:hypothetical protein RsY01_887 [Lactococcus reticulitermitis]|uniref:Uncharacterized protein n=1 Tax=Pseudolactococcus reticulitermitis TaxID=2025039 RepID=A0A224WYV4_9LACT|nr:hypothetical protein RsY01_887 [Lactococcus reticulitermitis]
MQGGGQHPKIVVPVLTPDRAKKRQNGRRFKTDGEAMFTLTAQDRHGVLVKDMSEKGVINPLKGKTTNGWHFEQQVYDAIGLARTLKAGGGSGNIPKVITNVNPSRNGMNGNVYSSDGIAPTLTTNKGEGPKILQRPRGFNSGGEHEIAPTLSSSSWQENNLLKVGGIYTNDSPDFNHGPLDNLSRTIKANSHDAGVTDGIRIRKLTPRECWRLQGFPDWTFDKAQGVNSNSQLYKQAGNSVTVNVISEIAKRLV